MLCEECGKNEATVHIQAIAPDGTSTQRALCAECMAKLKPRLPGVNAFDITDFLGALIGKIHAERQERDNDRFEATCSCCGSTWAEVRKSGRMGCAQCYKAFREPMEEILVKKNGSALFADNGPNQTANPNEAVYLIRHLREEMARAIKEEDFETAARLRDEIRAMEKKEASYADK